jgi:FkbM family methyltransferase
MLAASTIIRLRKMGKLGKLFVCCRSKLFRRALSIHRVAAAVEHTDILDALPDCLTVIDIGANRGQFALAARYRFPFARIISFEPLGRPAAKYRAVFGSDGRTTLHEVAIGPTRGSSLMHISGRDDSSSLLPITDTQELLFPGTKQAGTTSVVSGLLSDYIDVGALCSPALLKIDVQGFELQALLGCADALHRFDVIYVECSFIELYAGQALAGEIVAWLSARHFALTGVFNVAYRRGEAIQADFLFRRLTS